MNLKQFIEDGGTNMSATSEKDPKFKKTRRRFRIDALAMDYENIGDHGKEKFGMKGTTKMGAKKKAFLREMNELEDRLQFAFNRMKNLAKQKMFYIKEFEDLINLVDRQLKIADSYSSMDDWAIESRLYTTIFTLLDNDVLNKESYDKVINILQASKFNLVKNIAKIIPKGIEDAKKEIDKIKDKAKKLPDEGKKLKLKEWMEEGVEDKGIFKCLFLAGVPGAGKSAISKIVLSSHIGWRTVSPDKIYEFMMKDRKQKISKYNKEIYDTSREKVWEQQELYVKSRLPIVIDRTGADINIIEEIKKDVEKLGYETGMLFVKIDPNIAYKRNLQRERKITKERMKDYDSSVEYNYQEYKEMFGSRFWEIDNTPPLEQSKDKLNKIAKEIQTWALKIPQNINAQNWIFDRKGK